MDFAELVLECFKTLTLNKMRTGLAILGIIIGIGSVIALISIGQSSQQSITNSIQSLGSNLLTVSCEVILSSYINIIFLTIFYNLTYIFYNYNK